MKKNYTAVLQKAEDLTRKITLLIFALFGTVMCSTAQSSSQNIFAYTPVFPSVKGPFDAVAEKNLDASPPVIAYTPLTSTCTPGARTITATFTDADGIPTTGAGRPVLYWQINSGVFIASPGTFVSVAGTTSTFTFTLGAGSIAGNLVSYYFVAQDNVGNVIAKPSAGAAGYSTNPPAVGVDPTSPEFYVVQTTLAPGIYTVGAAVGNNFLTITDAVNAYNNSCLGGGGITFSLVDGNYDVSEVFPITIFNPQANATNTLTIKPAPSVTTTITGSSADAIFKFNGADYITIDGSNAVAGTTKNLTITNTNTGLNSCVIWVGSASASNGATHNTIKNCLISGNTPTTTLAGIVSSSGVIVGNAAETNNTDNTYNNNSIYSSYYGVMLMGPAAGGETNNVVSGSIIGNNQATKKLGYRGVLVSNQSNVQITGNHIEGISSQAGIGSDVEPTGGVIVSGVISGGSVNGNWIDDIKNLNVGSYPSVGVSLQATSTAANFKVYNNFIYSVTANGSNSNPGNNGIGISVISGGGYGIYFNSIHLVIAQQSSAGGVSSCLFVGPNVTGTGALDVRNNIFSDRRPTGTSGVSYAVYSSVPAIVFSNINYNDYYSIGPIGYLGSSRTTIANWQTATGMDGNSVSVNPIFMSGAAPPPPIDLHLQLISALNDQGQTIAGVTTDIDGTTRDAVKPDIGADEFTPPACSGNTGGTVTSDFATVCTSGSVSLSASGFSYGLGIAYQWQYSTSSATGPWTNIPGETNPTSCNAPVITVTTWYHLVVTCAAGAPGASTSLQIVVYNPAIASVVNGSRCGPGTVSLSATGSPTTAIQWYTALTGGAPVYTGNPFITPSLSTTTSYYVESTYLGSSGTVGLNDPTQATDISTQLTSWQVYFNVIQATKLLTVDIYPLATGENFSIEVYNAAGTILKTVPVTTNVSGGATAQTVDIQLNLPIGTGYYLYATAGLPTTGLTRNLTGAVYPYNSTDIVITGNEFNPNFYMCYYRWRFSNGCSSAPRTQVTANIGVSAALNVTATPAALCAGDNSNICVTSSNAAFNYTWLPGPLNGACQTVTPATTTTYTVNASDGTCTGTGTVTVTVNPASTNVVISPASVTRCSSAAAVQLTATGGDIAGVSVLSENFNGATNTWTTSTTGSTGSVANSAWTLRPDGYVASGLTIHSNDASQFYLSHSDANTGVTKTTLTSPAFSLAGYTSANLSFYHNYQYFGSPQDSATVEISQNGSTWTILAIYKSTKGGSTNFANPNISLNTWAGQPTNYIRFRYTAKDDIFWAIDNVNVTCSNSGAPITWAPLTGLYTNAAATAPYAYTGTATPTIWAMPTTTTTYTATATPPNACQKTQTITVVVNSVNAVMTASPSGGLCPNETVTVSVALTGTAPWNLTYSNGTPVTVNNIATSPYTFVVNPATTTSYTITALSDANCTASAAEIALISPLTITINPSSVSTWRGVNTDWTDPANWCGGVPTAARDVVIPSIPILPVITQTTPVARDITVSLGASITINSGGILSFTGNCTNDGTIINNGKIILNGTALQSFPGGTTGTITAMNDLEVNNGAGATINKGIKITGALIPTAGNIAVNDTITLRSTNTATARVAALGATAGFTYGAIGKFSVERYIRIPSVDSVGWRFLAAPIIPGVSGQTIKEAWQEGETAPTYSPSGYGMQIVGPASAGAGFDINTANPSLKTYNPATLGWVSVPGTTIPKISTTEGYMAFIRGNRTSNTFGSFSNTTLRMSGEIKTGPIGPISAFADGAFISVGNPYPSAIDFATTTRNGLLDVFYVWDPKLGSLYGGYQTVSGPGPVYTITPGGGSYSPGQTHIESGSAFFVKATAAAVPHNISFSESNKVSGSFQVQRLTTASKQLSTKLYSVGNAIRLNDGTLTQFDGAYSNNLDDNDIPKLSNFGENIGVLRDSTVLAVERHAEIVDTDTLFYQLSGLRQIGYELEFTPENIAQPGLTAYLEDAFLQTTTIINLNTVSIIDFNVTTDPASRAVNRFRLVFKQAGIVPVTFTSISAHREEKNIVVNWKVENELNIDHYEVERSSEGRSFKMIGSQVAKGNNSGLTQAYTWLDTEPFAGDNFYRIKSVGIGNDIKYSEIVKVNMKGDASMIVVYPNPVKDGVIGLSLNDQPKGFYDIKLLGANGQLLLKQQFYHQGGSERIKIPVGSNLSKGVYNLEIILPAKKKRSFKVVFE